MKKVCMRVNFLILILATVLLTSCSDGITTPPPPVTCRKVEMFGDSITRQAGQIITQFLPCYTVINHGADGTMVRHMRHPVWDDETIYTISYGANECLRGVSVSDYRLALNHVLNESKGKKVILEAPWQLVNPLCSSRIDQFREVVVGLSKKYDVPVVELDMNRDHDGAGIHLPQSHTTSRAKLLATEILKF